MAKLFLTKWAITGLFYRLFLVFSNNHDSFYNNICEKCQSSIRYQDSNVQLLEHESPPITARPGVLHNLIFRRHKVIRYSRLFYAIAQIFEVLKMAIFGKILHIFGHTERTNPVANLINALRL